MDRGTTGGLLAGFGVLAQVGNEWAKHLFYTAYQSARADALRSGTFAPPSQYADPTAVTVSMGIQLVILIMILGGLGLVAWAAWDEYRG